MTAERPPTSDAPIRYEDLRPGVRYRIVIDDCCIEAEFIAHFERWEPEARTAHFEGGTRLRDLVWFAYPA